MHAETEQDPNYEAIANIRMKAINSGRLQTQFVVKNISEKKSL